MQTDGDRLSCAQFLAGLPAGLRPELGQPQVEVSSSLPS